MIRRQFLGLLFVILFVAPTWSVMFAQAQGGNITTFSSGNQTETVTITSGQHAAVEFELNRNTTVTSASFFVSPSSSGSSVGALEIHANNDGAPEWAFNDTGYGVSAINMSSHPATQRSSLSSIQTQATSPIHSRLHSTFQVAPPFQVPVSTLHMLLIWLVDFSPLATFTPLRKAM